MFSTQSQVSLGTYLALGLQVVYDALTKSISRGTTTLQSFASLALDLILGVLLGVWMFGLSGVGGNPFVVRVLIAVLVAGLVW